MVIIVRDSAGAQLELPVRGDLADELVSLAKEGVRIFGPSRIGAMAAYSLLGILSSSRVPDTRPPTPAQIKFALDIVERLRVELPLRALQDRTVIGAFLTLYGDRLRKGPGQSNEAKHASDGKVQKAVLAQRISTKKAKKIKKSSKKSGG